MSDLIGTLSEKVVEAMKTSLKAARRVALTCDCWAGKNSKDNYFGLTAHFFDTSSGKRKSLKLGKYISSLYANVIDVSFIVACRQFNSSHNAENLSSKLIEILDEFGIAGKAWILLTDSAKNMERRKSLYSKVTQCFNSYFSWQDCKRSKER